MDTINFGAGDRFPVSVETLEALRGMAAAAGALAGMMGGTTEAYALSGCAMGAVNGSGQKPVSAGWAVAGGEVLPFAGGFVGASDTVVNVRVVETRRSVVAEGVTYADAYVRRELQLTTAALGTHRLVGVGLYQIAKLREEVNALTTSVSNVWQDVISLRTKEPLLDARVRVLEDRPRLIHVEDLGSITLHGNQTLHDHEYIYITPQPDTNYIIETSSANGNYSMFVEQEDKLLDGFWINVRNESGSTEVSYHNVVQVLRP